MPPEDNPTEEKEDTSLRDELESAIKVDEDDNASEEKTEKKTETEEGSDEKKSTEDLKSGEQQDEGDSSGDKEDEDKREPTPIGINAPIGFSPESREKWKDVPDLIKEQIQKREVEIEAAIANTGEFRRTHTALEKLAQSYAPILAAEGANSPMQAIEGMFRTVAELRVGSPQQVATKMAQLIGHYGVDIEMLDQALSGNPVQSTEMSAMQQMIDSRLAPIQTYMENQKNTTDQEIKSSQVAVNDELQEFSKDAEFLNDVREDMADFIDAASKQGRKMDFREAYDKACVMNVNISKIIGERKSAEALKNSGEKVTEKKNAASSLSSSSGDSSKKKESLSLRGEIEELYDAAAE